MSGLLLNWGIGPQQMYLPCAALTAISVLLLAVLLPHDARAGKLQLDIWGALTFAGGLVALLLVASRGAAWGWTSAPVLVLAVCSALLLSAWLIIEKHAAAPLIDLRLLRKPVVLGTNATALLNSAAMIGSFILITHLVQTSRPGGQEEMNQSLAAGLAILPLPVMMLAATAVVAPLIRALGQKGTLVVGNLIIATSFPAMYGCYVHEWYLGYAAGLLGVGLGLSLGLVPSLLANEVDDAQSSIANGINQTLRSVGTSIGTTAALTILAVGASEGARLLDGDEIAFGVFFIIAVLGVVLSAAIPRMRTRYGGRGRD